MTVKKMLDNVGEGFVTGFVIGLIVSMPIGMVLLMWALAEPL